MKSNVEKGAFILIISGIICKFFGGLFRLPLTNIVGMEGIGMFQMIMSIYSLALVFVSGGVTNALSKLTSSARARGDHRVIGSYLRYGFLFSGTEWGCKLLLCGCLNSSTRGIRRCYERAFAGL